MMRFTKSRWLAAISPALAALPLFFASPAHASKRPHYGGTLRVELLAAAVSLDPREWKTGSPAASDNEQVAALVFDRLVTLDDFGRFQPVLAGEWSHDPAYMTWQFKLRPNAKFSDGSPLTPSDVVTSLQPLLPAGLQIAPNESGVTIRASHPAADLLAQLASGRYFVFRVQPDGTLLGTGPFYVAGNIPAIPSEANPSVMRAPRMQLRANEGAWSGRPFLDALDVALGVPPLRQLLDLQLGKADIIQIAPDLVRKARQENLRIWSSTRGTLLALRFDEVQPAVADLRLRQALALAMDRETMAHVLLQRQAQPTAALLPEWLSGYAFLFDSPLNLQRAREIRAALHANEAGGSEPLRLRADAVGDLMKLLGERVAVNAQQANLTVQLVPHLASGTAPGAPAGSAAGPAGLHLFAWRYDSLSPQAELDALVKQLYLQESAEPARGLDDPEQRYEEERCLLQELRVVPLLVLPDYVGIAPNVRNWMPARWGEWRLADVWLEQNETLPAALDTALPRDSASAQVPGVRP